MRFAVCCAASLSLLFAATATAGVLTVQVRDSTGKALADAVVYAEPDGATSAPKPMHPAEIEQKGLKFAPLVTVIQTGSRISFPNNDKVRHHIYSFSPAKRFDQKLYSGVAASPQVFDKAGTVVLGCNIHDKMVAYVKVVDTPYFARTDGAGVARIELPGAASYSVKAWHYNMPTGASAEQAFSAKAGELAGALTFTLAQKPPTQDSDALDGTGYRP